MSDGEAAVTSSLSVNATGALKAIAAAEREAKANGWRVSIAIVDPAGDLLAFHRMDGAARISIDAAIAKVRTTARFGAPTKRLHDALEAGALGLLAVPGLTPLAGGAPILLDKALVGAVGVSGGRAEEDVQIAKAGAAAAVTPTLDAEA